ncbi:MAG: DUF3413 domain-containing protein [Lachnospiraceae bacterium]|nr:DUF3413 domain-containing protein [Lachnospiraceae bacterium]
MISIIISLLITLLLGCLEFYFFLPAINIHSVSFWIFIICQLVVFALIYTVISYKKIRRHKRRYKKLYNILGAVAGLLLAFVILGCFFSSRVFHAKKYSSRITVETGDFNSDIPVLSDISKIPLMDTASAKKLGNRTVGSLTEVVSQYDVSDTYNTICYKGEVMKTSPLEYAGFFKYNSNRKSGIPGYVLVNPTTNEAEYIKLEKGIKYSPSGYFSGNLLRKIRMDYPSKLINSYNFQIDDNGKPYWIITCQSPSLLFGCYSPDEVIVLDAVTGKSDIYDINNTPEWIDMVYGGRTVEALYNSYGILSKGYFNSLFSQKGCTQTTDDFGYVIKDDDVYIYTGITSTVSDESNLGFILANSRTGKYKYYKCAGAEEYSAMSAAEGVVQNFGYDASFPALINIGGEPVYAMVLKDSNGLVKLYSMVNVKNYTIVATGDSLSQTLTNYQTALINAGTKIDIKDISTDIKEITITISDIQFIATDGNTTCYIKDENGGCYKQDFADNENLILLNKGDNVTISYNETDNENDIPIITSIKKTLKKE